MKSVKLNIIIYIFNLIMVVIGTIGNKIGNDTNGNLLIQTISEKFIDLSCNEVKINNNVIVEGNIEICGNIINNNINNKILNLETENYIIKNALNDLLSGAGKPIIHI